MTRLRTLGPEGKRTVFAYDNSIVTGVKLHQAGNPVIDASFFQAALEHFAGQEVEGGFREDDPPKGGFGDWVERKSGQLNSRKLSPHHASFMAAILCHESEVTDSLRGTAVWLRFPEKVAPKEAARKQVAPKEAAPKRDRASSERKNAELAAKLGKQLADLRRESRRALKRESEE